MHKLLMIGLVMAWATSAQAADAFDGKLPAPKTVSNIECQGTIDLLNGIVVNPKPAQAVVAERTLQVDGWMTLATDKGTLPEQVYVTLTDAKGNTEYFKTRRIVREDVKKHFNRPELIDAGYQSLIDLTQRQGQAYKVGVVRVQAGKYERCTQWNVPFTVAGTAKK